MTRRISPSATAWMCAAVVAFSPVCDIAAGQAATGKRAAERLEEIRGFLEKGSANQRAASLRQLNDEIRLDDIDEFRAYLVRRLPVSTLYHFRRRYDELVTERLSEAEQRIVTFVTARRRVADLTGIGRAPSPAAPQGTPEDVGEQRKIREESRRDSHRYFESLLRHGVGIAPVLRRRIEAGVHPSDYVERFRQRLLGAVITDARRQFPVAPAAGALSPFERRALVAMAADLAGNDADETGWTKFRDDAAAEGLALFSTFAPVDVREARLLFLDLGDWGIARMDQWANEKETGDRGVPPDLRRTYAEWNRLHVPVDFPASAALPVASFRDRTPDERQEMIHRMVWVAGSTAIPILARILELDPDRRVQVEAAAALARLSDVRGAAFLERIGLEEAELIDAISRQVLLAGALARREMGDLTGALSELERLLARFPGDFDIQFELGLTALRAGNYAAAIENLRAASGREPDSSLAHYNLACAYALGGQPDNAIAEVRAAITAGFRDANHMASDPDLKSLHERNDFKEILEELRDR